MTDVTLESPLVGIAALSKRELHADGRSCVLDEIALLDMLNLRGDAGDSAEVIQHRHAVPEREAFSTK